jgi:hypothetical protein
MLQRVFIAQGSGVTINYIIQKGSACVEAFREITHIVSQFFRNRDAARRSKEVAFMEDMRILVEDMEKHGLHHATSSKHFVPALKPAKACTGKKTTPE